MKEVLCIYECWDGIPYFHFKGGERYGPAKNDVCKVIEQITCGVYYRDGREVVYYILEGYDKPDHRFVTGRVMFPDSQFVDLISDQALAEELAEIKKAEPLYKSGFSN